MKNLLFGLIFACAGIGVGIYGLNEYKKAKASTTWPSTEGTIQSSEVKRSTSHSTSSGRSRSKTSYKARISYTYTANGQFCTGRRVSFGGTRSSSNRSAASRIVSKYRVASKVKVFYDPKDPTTSVLEPGMAMGVYILMIIGGVFTLIGVVVMVMGFLGKNVPITFNSGNAGMRLGTS